MRVMTRDFRQGEADPCDGPVCAADCHQAIPAPRDLPCQGEIHRAQEHRRAQEIRRAACWATWIVLPLVCWSSALAQTAVAIAPSQTNAEGFLPYRPAELTVRNDSDQVIRGIAIRMREGGPTFLHGVAIPPQTSQTLTIPLPALQENQAHVVRLLKDDSLGAPVVGEFQASVNWDPNHVETAQGAFLYPGIYSASEESLPLWPRSLLRNVFLGAVVTCLALAGAIFIRRPRWRLAAVVGIVALATAGVLHVLAREPVVLVNTVEKAVRPKAPVKSYLVVSCRRTTEWTTSDAALAPVYFNKLHLAEDDTVIHWGRTLTTGLRPREVRVFRRVGEGARPSTPPATGASELPRSRQTFPGPASLWSESS
jgi:hypothetical protein